MWTEMAPHEPDYFRFLPFTAVFPFFRGVHVLFVVWRVESSCFDVFYLMSLHHLRRKWVNIPYLLKPL